MPLPLMFIFALLVSVLAALAGRVELRTSPQHVLLTGSAASYVLYAAFVLAPISVYFYVFHGDWSVFYLLDVQQIPSAAALVYFMLQVGGGLMLFVLCATLIRNQHDNIVYVIFAFCAAVLVLAAYALRARMTQVGTYAQFHGNFGLEPLSDGVLMQGMVAMGTILSVGLLFLLGRLWFVGRRL